MKIRPELREEVIARSASGHSYAQIAAWLASEHDVRVTPAAVEKTVVRGRTDAARTVAKANIAEHVEKSTAPKSLKAFRVREVRALKILRRIEDRLLGQAGGDDDSMGVGLVDAYAKVSAVVIRYGELHRKDLEATGSDTSRQKLDAIFHAILAKRVESRGPGE